MLTWKGIFSSKSGSTEVFKLFIRSSPEVLVTIGIVLWTSGKEVTEFLMDFFGLFYCNSAVVIISVV